MSRIRIHGIIVNDSDIYNTVTGQPQPYQRLHVTVSDSHTGGLYIRERDPVIQCFAGDIIQRGELLAFCCECGRPVCTRHSIQDPFCGHIFCLPHSRIIEMQGLTLRICNHCYRRIREGWFKKTIRSLLGEK